MLYLKTLLQKIEKGSFFSLMRIFNVKDAGMNWKKGDKFHDNMHMLFVKKGSCIYVIEGSEVKLKTGDVILIAPKTHYFGAVRKDANLSVFSLRFDLMAKKNIKENAYTKPGYVLLRPKNSLKYRRIFYRLHIRYNQINNPYESLQTRAILTDLIIDMNLEIESGSLLSKDDPIYLIKTYIEENPDAIVDNEKMAKMAMMSQRSLQRHFKNKMGISLYAFVVRSKINYSTYLLEETSMSISEVASFLGYANQFSFSKSFKKQLGFSPSDFRKRSLDG